MLNNFFPNIVKNLKVPKYKNLNPNFLKMLKISFLRQFLKYKIHPSIFAIKEKYKNSKFTFHEVQKRINKLRVTKIKSLTIPVTTIHKNADTLAYFFS